MSSLARYYSVFLFYDFVVSFLLLVSASAFPLFVHFSSFSLFLFACVPIPLVDLSLVVSFLYSMFISFIHKCFKRAYS